MAQKKSFTGRYDMNLRIITDAEDLMSLEKIKETLESQLSSLHHKLTTGLIYYQQESFHMPECQLY